jgi:hypothetical protein
MGPGQDLLTEQAFHQVDSQQRGPIALIERGIEFHDVERSQQPESWIISMHSCASR